MTENPFAKAPAGFGGAPASVGGFGKPLTPPPSGMEAFALVAYTGQFEATGRLMLIRPSSVQHGIKGDDGKDYSAIWCTKVVFLDGPPSDSVPSLPLVVTDFRLSGAFLINMIAPRYDVSPLAMLNTGRPNEFAMTPKSADEPWVLGRAAKVRNKRNTGSWTLLEYTEQDAATAMAWLAANPDAVSNPWG